MNCKAHIRVFGPRSVALLIVLVTAVFQDSKAEALRADAINNAALEDLSAEGPNAARVKAQILLDRHRFSPGVIDGQEGENTRSAIEAFQEARGIDPTGELDRPTWDALAKSGADPVIHEYRITKEDVSGPFANIPERMKAQAKLDRLAYSNARERLAEKFHMHEELLSALNPGKNFDKAGTPIAVARVRSGSLGKVARVVVDKGSNAVRAYGEAGDLLAHFPATAGSEARPAPTGTFKIARIVKNPSYTYRPELEFAGVKADEPFEIAPGPNNPVGTVWIEIDKDGYGLHGTPDPVQIAKSSSHGCIRLTNWDAEDLASGASEGVAVELR